MITDKMKENAHKITYLISVYPTKNLADIINMIQLPPIQINSAIWAATELGYISEPNAETGLVKLISPPEPFEFGEVEQELENALEYCFNKMILKEQDLEENYLNSWLTGYGSHDHIIAIKQLISRNILAEYSLQDGENEYIFYTTFENREQEWGRKQFKKDPVANKKKKK